MSAVVRRHGLHLVNVPGDGNCCVYATMIPITCMRHATSGYPPSQDDLGEWATRIMCESTGCSDELQVGALAREALRSAWSRCLQHQGAAGTSLFTPEEAPHLQRFADVVRAARPPPGSGWPPGSTGLSDPPSLETLTEDANQDAATRGYVGTAWSTMYSTANGVRSRVVNMQEVWWAFRESGLHFSAESDWTDVRQDVQRRRIGAPLAAMAQVDAWRSEVNKWSVGALPVFDGYQHYWTCWPIAPGFTVDSDNGACVRRKFTAFGEFAASAGGLRAWMQ